MEEMTFFVLDEQYRRGTVHVNSIFLFKIWIQDCIRS